MKMYCWTVIRHFTLIVFCFNLEVTTVDPSPTHGGATITQGENIPSASGTTATDNTPSPGGATPTLEGATITPGENTPFPNGTTLTENTLSPDGATPTLGGATLSPGDATHTAGSATPTPADVTYSPVAVTLTPDDTTTNGATSNQETDGVTTEMETTTTFETTKTFTSMRPAPNIVTEENIETTTTEPITYPKEAKDFIWSTSFILLICTTTIAVISLLTGCACVLQSMIKMPRKFRRVSPAPEVKKAQDTQDAKS